MKTALVIAGVVVGLWLAHRVALWAESRGWIHYRNPPRGSVSYGVSQVDALFRPEVEHVIEMRDEERVGAEVDESGAPPVVGVGGTAEGDPPRVAGPRGRGGEMAVDPGRLDGVSLFANLGDDDRARLAEVMREREVPIGTVLSKESDLATHVFVIEEGRAAVSTSGGFATLLGPGDVVGEIGAIEQVRRTANVVAVTDLKVLAVMGWDFREMNDQIPALCDTIKTTIHSRLDELGDNGG